MATYNQSSVLSGFVDSAIFIVQFINDTTYDWSVNVLPSNLTVVDSTLTNGVVINGTEYYGIAISNGTVPEINGTVIVQLAQPSMIGTLPLVSFIYMIMTFLVILIMAYTVISWVEAVVTQRSYEYTFFLPTNSLTERRFNKQLRRYYPDESAGAARPSYAETVLCQPGSDFTPEDLREVRELIREKYAMDVRIWNSRFVHEAHLATVEDWKIRSRGATLDMLKSVQGWVGARDQWSTEEWAQVTEINQRITQLEQAEQARYQASSQ